MLSVVVAFGDGGGGRGGAGGGGGGGAGGGGEGGRRKGKAMGWLIYISAHSTGDSVHHVQNEGRRSCRHD